MRDMPRPRSPQPPPDHARHDPSLVAQLAARDRLAADQQREAQRLVSTCPACAELAADLRTLAAAVRLEPTPPRRRDFRLDAEQAERLRGNVVERFLRRLSLPQSRAFGPAAAGALSLGLVFVVAGYAWPGEDGAILSSEPVPPAAVEFQLASPTLEQAFESQALGADASPDGLAPLGAAHKNADTSAEERDAVLPRGMDIAAQGAAEDTAADDTAATDTVAEPSDAAELFFSVEAAASVAPAEAETGSANDVAGATSASATDDRPPMVAWLTAIGFALAIIGGLLSLLAWLTRRASDPLLR
jgi:hypothetical protein